MIYDISSTTVKWGKEYSITRKQDDPVGLCVILSFPFPYTVTVRKIIL